MDLTSPIAAARAVISDSLVEGTKEMPNLLARFFLFSSSVSSVVVTEGVVVSFD